jgi:hypothetical protein
VTLPSTVARQHLQAGSSERGSIGARLDEQPLYVVGGRQRSDRSVLDSSSSWYGYAVGVVLRIDGSGVETVHEYVSRPGTCGPDDAVLFKSASRFGDELFCCTQTEIVIYGVPQFEERAYISLPIFNDVHHVVPTPSGTLLVAVSGLETVVEVTRDGQVLREWNVLGEDTWATHDRNVDYRQGVNLKPHRSHPNHVFLLGDEPFATRFEGRDAISLLDPTRRIEIGGERIHDGLVRDDTIYFTTVDGQVVLIDRSTLREVARHPLARRVVSNGDVVLGWCRAVYVDDEHCWVGFSRIRPTKLRQTVSWIRTGGAEQAPTRIARYRLSDWVCDAEIDVEPYGLNAVFSILPV